MDQTWKEWAAATKDELSNPYQAGENKTSPSNSMESVPGEQVWVDYLEASARVKT